MSHIEYKDQPVNGFFLAKYRYICENRKKLGLYSVGKIKNIDVKADVSHSSIVLVRSKDDVVDLLKTVIVWL